jgi:hypothetical protein
MTDWFAVVEYSLPVIVAIFAVWLGFRYQRVSADVESRREAWIRVLSYLNKEMDLLETVEKLSYICNLVEKLDRDESPSRKTPDMDRDRVIFLTLQLCAELDPGGDWSRLVDSGPDGLTELLHHYPSFLRAVAHASFEQEKRKLRDEGPRLLLGSTRIWRSKKRREEFTALQNLTWHLSRAFHAINPETPAKLDWSPIYQLGYRVQTLAVKDLGARPVNVALIQVHELVPWPEGTPVLNPAIGPGESLNQARAE